MMRTNRNVIGYCLVLISIAAVLISAQQQQHAEIWRLRRENAKLHAEKITSQEQIVRLEVENNNWRVQIDKWSIENERMRRLVEKYRSDSATVQDAAQDNEASRSRREPQKDNNEL